MGWAVVDSAIEAYLFTIIFNAHHSWHIHPLKCFTGVRGHSPPEKCQNLRLIKAQISEKKIGGGGTVGRAPLPLDQLLMDCIIRLG